MEELDPQQQLRLAERVYATLQVGQEMGPWERVLTPEDVRAYAAAIDDENPWYLRDSVQEPTVCHPAMTAPFGIWLFQETRSKILGDPVPPLVGVHTAAHHQYTNPVPVGKRLIVHGKVVDKYIRSQRYYVVVEFWTVDEDGHDIVHITDTFLLTPVRIPEKAD